MAGRVRLATVNIKNFRCLEDVSVNMSGLTVLLGPNSAGKSSFLRALAFFFEGTPLDVADVFGGADHTASVECIFSDLTDPDREALGPYALGNQVVLRRSFRPGSEPTLSGRGRRFAPFEQVRSESGGKRTAAYKALRAERADLELEEAKSIPTVEQAMLTFEQNHPELCDIVDDPTAGKFLGYNSVGKSKLAERFPFVFVPAMRDAADDAVERPRSLLTRLLTAVAEQRAEADESLKAIEDDARVKYEKAISTSHAPVLKELADRLSEQIRRYVPSGEIKLAPAAANFSIGAPRIDLLGGEERDLTDLGRQGHGFQRAFIISALEYLAEADATAQDSGEKPTLFLAIEEPELYQHPPRARHFFKTLATIAESPSVQVCYATHSPYFVSAERFDSLRLFRRKHMKESGRGATVTAAILDVVADYLPDVERANARSYLARTLSEQFRETFFAKGVLLTEGPSDAAVLETAAELLGLGSLAADGVVITNVGGKGSQPVALAILGALGIPTFCVFDSDGDSRDGDACEACGRAKLDRTSAAASNRKILASLGGPEVDFPPNTVEARWACFETEIEDAIEGFRKTLSGVQNEMGWRRKAPVAYAETLRRVGVQALSPEIAEILIRTRGLAGLNE